MKMGNRVVFGIFESRLGIPEYEAKRFEGRVKEGGILLSVHADDVDWATKAEKILALTGAEDIATGSEVASAPRNPKKSSQNALLAAFPI